MEGLKAAVVYYHHSEPASAISRTGILGVGNLLLRDEGFGVHVVERLKNDYVLPRGLEVLDGGTAGIMLAPFIESVDSLYIIDTVKSDSEPGTIMRFSGTGLYGGSIRSGISPHQLGLLEVLDLCRLREQAPERVVALAAVPEDLSTGTGLSSTLESCVGQVIDLLREELGGRGLHIASKAGAGRA